MLTKKVFHAAAVHSLPVFMGYLTMGAAAGILLAAALNKGSNGWWGFITSATSVSGALEFAVADWVRNRPPILDVAAMTLGLNIRYAMYGMSFISTFNGEPWYKKWYFIFALTDETYALAVSNQTPEPENSISYILTVAGLNHLVWIIGVTAGAIFGSMLKIPHRGLDFAMTALFLVILTDQCRKRHNRYPALIGLTGTAFCAVLLPARKVLIPAMALILIILLSCRKFLATPEVKR